MDKDLQDKTIQNSYLNTYLEIEKGFPKKLVILSYLLIFLVLVWVGVNNYIFVQKVNANIRRNYTLSQLQDEMAYIATDSVQTIKLLTTMGDFKWEEAHKRDLIALKGVFKEAKELAVSPEMREKIADIETINSHLTDMENSAINWVHQNKNKEALAVIV